MKRASACMSSFNPQDFTHSSRSKTGTLISCGSLSSRRLRCLLCGSLHLNIVSDCFNSQQPIQQMGIAIKQLYLKADLNFCVICYCFMFISDVVEQTPHLHFFKYEKKANATTFGSKLLCHVGVWYLTHTDDIKTQHTDICVTVWLKLQFCFLETDPPKGKVGERKTSFKFFVFSVTSPFRPCNDKCLHNIISHTSPAINRLLWSS